MRLGLLMTVVAVAASSPTAAAVHPATAPSEGYTYFNWPNANAAEHDAAVRECTTLTNESNDNPTLIWQSYVVRTNIENCMVVRGWRVFRLSKEAGARLPARRQELAATIAPWFGLEQPPGILARQWSNDAGDAGSSGVPLREAYPGRSLSIEAVDIGPIRGSPASSEDVRGDNFVPGYSTIQKPTEVAALVRIPEGMAVVVVTLLGDSPNTFLHFGRVGPDYETPSWKDGKPTWFAMFADRDAKKALKQTGRFQRTAAFVVPPGRWKVAGVGGALSFCLGGPVAEVKAGEVVFLGRFDFTSRPFLPDLSLGEPRAYLAAVPRSSEQLRPAVWRNGEAERCERGFTYALEFPGAPFVEPHRPAAPPSAP